jgi:hypothetical protein
MSSQPALRLHGRHPLRALPLGFETGAANVKVFSTQVGGAASKQDGRKNLNGYGSGKQWFFGEGEPIADCLSSCTFVIGFQRY